MMAGIWILGCLCLICLLFLLVLLHDLKAINGQLKYKNQQHSHFEVYVQSPFRQIKQLQQHINALYEDIWLTEEKAQKKEREMNLYLQRKSSEVDSRIEQELEQVEEEINHLISDKTATILTEVISSKLTKSDYNHLIDKSIGQIKEGLSAQK